MEGPVRPSLLAEKLGVKRPSVTRAMTMLAKKGLVHHEPYGALKLTKAGRALGREIVRRDDCLTALLVEVLGMSPEQADPQVHSLEHLVSDELLVRLEALVEQIRVSKPWLRRLHERLAEAARHQNDATSYDPGRATVHGGSRHER